MKVRVWSRQLHLPTSINPIYRLPPKLWPEICLQGDSRSYPVTTKLHSQGSPALGWRKQSQARYQPFCTTLKSLQWENGYLEPHIPVLPYWKVGCFLYINRNYPEISQVNKKFGIPRRHMKTRARKVDGDFIIITMYILIATPSQWLRHIWLIPYRTFSAGHLHGRLESDMANSGQAALSICPTRFQKQTKKMESKMTQVICYTVGLWQVRPHGLIWKLPWKS